MNRSPRGTSEPPASPEAPDGDRPPCAGLWTTPMVHIDGTLTTCCMDEHLENRLGNLGKESLADLWYGDTIERWRMAQVEGRFHQSGPYCTRCNWPSAGALPAHLLEAWLARRRRHP